MPKWLDNAIFYEIYPQTFLDTNGDGIGDFQGIIRKLDYIKELGCNAIWLNPCFVSPFSDAGYDVADYYTAAPRYGTNEDLKELFAKAHEKGMHVILDLVPGHTSIEHPWFKASLSPEENEFTHRYIWTDRAWKGFENVGNIKGCIRGLSDRDGSCAANYYTTQPALNYGFYKVTESWQKDMHSPEAMATREAIKDIMRFWLGMGCDGFRVDMAGSLVKNDEDGKGTIELWQDFRRFLDEEFPEAAMISEWGQPDKSLEGGYHMDFLLHFGPSYYMDLFRSEHPYFKRDGKGSIGDFVRTYQANYDKTNGKGLICIPSGDHDKNRPTVETQMAEEDSLFHEVQKLIRIRLGHEALQSNAPLEFLYAEDNAYPLVYKRTGETETIVIALNPSDKEVSCKIEERDGKEVLYSNNGEAVLKNGTLTVPPASASFIKIK